MKRGPAVLSRRRQLLRHLKRSEYEPQPGCDPNATTEVTFHDTKQGRAQTTGWEAVIVATDAIILSVQIQL